MGVEDVDALARARDDECAKTAAASPHARRQNAFNRPARQGRTAIIDDHARADDKALRRVVGTVALLNLAYFGVEFAVALRRSEERRVGKECVSTCRSRWAP